jgi:hypothetical protein
MKKIVLLILFLAVITSGCSYDITAGNSQELQGENENWTVDYTIKFTTIYHHSDEKVYAESMKKKKITVTYKKDLSGLFSVRHMETSYQDSFGGKGKTTEEYDAPPTDKQFQVGSSASATTHEASGLATPENLQKFIMIYSGPCYEMRANASAAVTITTDGKTETVALLPVENPSPIAGFLEDMNKKLSKKPFLRFFSGSASDLLLKLEKCNIYVVGEKTMPGSINAGENGEEQESVPAALHYEFVLRNEGRKPISGSLQDLEIKIVPGNQLRKASEETVGVNLFESDSAFGSGQSVDANIFNPHTDCSISLTFDLGEGGPEGTQTPSKEKLDKLRKNASDASLVINYKGQEAACFDLNKI